MIMSIHIYDSWVTITHGDVYHNVIVNHLVRSYYNIIKINIVIIVIQGGYKISYFVASYRIVLYYIYIYSILIAVWANHSSKDRKIRRIKNASVIESWPPKY